MSGLSSRIRAARRRSGHSQASLANALGVSRGAVANWESSSSSKPSVARLIDLAKTTFVRIEWLATGRGEMVYGQEDGDSMAAVDAEIVEDSNERLLILAFRNSNRQVQQILLTLARSTERSTSR